MNLSESTINTLNNFAQINGNILIEPGNKLKTFNESQTVFSNATIADEFPVEMGIYDLGEFLSIVNLVGDLASTDFDFQDKSVILTNGSTKVKYWYASRDVLKYPEKNIKMPAVGASFEISGSVLSRLKRAATTFGHSYLSFYQTESGTINGKVYDPEMSSSNTFEVEVSSEVSDTLFNYVFNIQNLKYLCDSDKFSVNLASKGKAKIAEFSSTDISYYVAVDGNSTMGGE